MSICVHVYIHMCVQIHILAIYAYIYSRQNNFSCITRSMRLYGCDYNCMCVPRLDLLAPAQARPSSSCRRRGRHWSDWAAMAGNVADVVLMVYELVCVCQCVHVHMCTYTYTPIRRYWSIYVCTHVRMHACMNVWVHSHTCIYVCVTVRKSTTSPIQAPTTYSGIRLQSCETQP